MTTTYRDIPTDVIDSIAADWPHLAAMCERLKTLQAARVPAGMRHQVAKAVADAALTGEVRSLTGQQVWALSNCCLPMTAGGYGTASQA